MSQRLNRPAGAIDLLVEQQKIAHQQRVLHAFRRNEKRLQHKCEQKQRHHHRAQQRGQRLRQRGQMQPEWYHLPFCDQLLVRHRCLAPAQGCSLSCRFLLPWFDSRAGRQGWLRRLPVARAPGGRHPVRRASWCFQCRAPAALPGSPVSVFSRTSTRNRLR